MVLRETSNTKILSALICSITDLLKSEYNDSLSCQYARWIVQALFNEDTINIMTRSNYILTPALHLQLEKWLTLLLVDKMPLAYVLGSIPFANVTLCIEPPTLIPRPETEEWVIHLIDKMNNLLDHPLTILDMATGSGCIAIALAHTFKNAHIYAYDICPQAVSLARKNVRINNVNNVTVEQSDLFSNLAVNRTYDLIVCNPPYIPQEMWSHLEPSVTLWEDKNALIAADNGTALIKKIIDCAPSYLKINDVFKKNNIPSLVIEIDHTQGQYLTQYMMNNTHFKNVSVTKDYTGNDRVINGSYF